MSRVVPEPVYIRLPGADQAPGGTHTRTVGSGVPPSKGTPMTDTLAVRIAEALKGPDADPQVITERLMPTLTPEERHALAFVGLRDRVRSAIRAERQPTLLVQAGSRKWEAVAANAADPLRWRLSVGDEWRLLGECTRDEVMVIAADYRGRALSNAEWAAKYDALAALLVDGMTVADIEAAVLAEVLS